MKLGINIFHHTNVNTVSDDDVMRFLNSSKDIKYIILRHYKDERLRQAVSIDFDRYNGCNLLAMLHYRPGFTLGDFEGAVSDICQIFTFSKCREFGWARENKSQLCVWEAHVLLGNPLAN